jgi:predicted PurR-regulated permease PerM
MEKRTARPPVPLPQPRRAVSAGERRVTYAVKILLLVVLAGFVLLQLLQFLGRVGSVTVIAVGAIFFAYLIYPAVRRLNERMPLGAALAVVYGVILVAVVFAGSVIVPLLANDVNELVKNSPRLAVNAQQWLVDPGNPITSRLPSQLRVNVEVYEAKVLVYLEHYATTGLHQIFDVMLSVVGLAATIVIIPVMAAYMMLDAESLKRSAVGVIPPKARPKMLSLVKDLESVLGGFIRGQLLVGAVIGTCITIALLLLHVEYAVLIGVTAGVLDVIPYVGAVVAFVPSVLLALFQDGVSQAALIHAAWVAGTFIVIFQLEGHFIAPKIVSDSVGLSPLWVILAILVGGELLGIPGMFLAVPIAAMLRVLLMHFVPRFDVPATVQEAKPGTTDKPLAETRPGTATGTVK